MKSSLFYKKALATFSALFLVLTTAFGQSIDLKKAEQEARRKGMTEQEIGQYLTSLAKEESYTSTLPANDPKAWLKYIFPSDSIRGFDEIAASNDALQRGFFGIEFKVYMYSAKRSFINQKYHYTPNPPMGTGLSGAKGVGGNGVLNAPCVNEDFEASAATTCTTSACALGASLGGWTLTQGQNSGINGSCSLAGCCPTAGSTNAWIRGTPWTDPGPMGVIPNSPLGGSKIIQLNDNIASTGEIVRINQTFPVTNSNALFSFAYMAAMDGSGHACCDQPFLKISLYDCSNNPLACSSVSITPPGFSCVSSVPGGWTTTATGISYTPSWQVKYIDLSPYIGSCVTIQVTVGDCDGWAHYGYCYFDAVCSSGGGAAVSFCNGTGNAVLQAPAGYTAYQWIAPGGSIIPAPSGTQPTYTVTSPVAGQIYTVQVVTAAGCTLTLRDTIKVTNVNIQSITSSPSCLGGTSGTASVQVTGSNMGYNYVWQNSSSSTISTSQQATNLPPGNYSVTVSTPSCGVVSGTVAVQVSPPAFYTKIQNYCGSMAIITASVGTGYTWYNNLAPMPSAAGQSSIVINNPINNAVYYVTYTTPQGCKDSVKYTLSQIPGGSTYVSNIKSICPTSGPISYGVVNLNTTQSGPYSYTVSGPGSYYSTLLNTTSKKDSVTGLAIGVYTANIFDGACFYTQTFTVSPYTYNYTVTPTNTVLCISGTVPMSVNFGTMIPTSCGLSSSGGCTSPNIIPIGTGNVQNTQYTYPSIYGNWYKNCRHQLLYTAAELLAAGVQPGKISSIDWFVTSMLPLGTNSSFYIGTLQGFQIQLKCTNLTTLNNTFDNTGLSLVYGPISYSPVNGWNNHSFTTAYEWDGVSSILVDVCYTINNSVSYTSNPIMPSTNTGVFKCRYAYSDVTPMCGTTTFATTDLNRPNIRFGNCGATNPANFTYSWTPSYALSSTNTQSTVSTPSASTIYTVTVDPIGMPNCSQSQTVNIIVAIPTTPTITGGPFCTNFSPVQLTVTPTTGSWTPTSYLTSGGVFSPASATVGANQVVYTTGAGTCVASNTLNVNVEQYNPSTITGTIVPLCVTDPTVNLMGIVANTTGTWTGTGVSGTSFDPSVSGAGNFNLVYNTQSSPTASLCPSQSSIQVGVYTVQQPTITQVGPYCDNMQPVQLSVVPMGGIYSGPATTSAGMFDPATATIGGNIVGYTITNGPCVKTTSININVEKFIPATITGNLGPYCFNDPGGNLAGIVLNMGGTWSGPGVSGNWFSPSSSGAGDFLVTYSTHSNPTAGLCPDAKSLNIHVNPAPLAPISASTLNACMPASIQFEANPNGNGTGVWYISDGSSISGLGTNHTFPTAGSYTVTYDYTDDIGCKTVSQLPGPITIYPLPVADFQAQPEWEVSIADPYVEFINTSSNLNQNTYFWNIAGIAGSYDINTSWTFTKPGSNYVTLIAINEYGCMDTITKIVSVKNEYGIWVPNSFTPNGDGLNDEFRASISPYGIDITDFEFDVFDRWGERVFTTKDFMIGWNGAKFNKGEIMKEDTYVYKMRFRTIEKESIYRTGHVTLIK